MELTKPLGYYTDNTALRFHMLDVGEGLMILIIFPNDQVMLFDCNVTDDNESTILDYLSANIPFKINPATGNTEQFIDVFVNSHRDEDHYRGLKKINAQYPIQSIWDSGQTGATTKSLDGHLLGFISSNGNYTVVPSRFCEIQTAARSLSATIECTYSQNGEEKSVPNGSKLSVGGKLYFKLKTAGGIIDPIEKVRVVWEVSNGGIGTHSSHQEIYFKGRAEDNNMFTFSRDLSYYGTHLLRCKISNARKGTITRIFKVVGV